jgi:protein-S-isoprenylcysteine O-methyltransferase Ste14
VSAWRHAAAIVLLPGTVTVVVPAVILATGDEWRWGLGDGAVAALTVVAGALLVAAGLALWAWTVLLFARVGRGTLAPWDPTRRLVVVGPYRHVRNPMISGVFGVLVGEALAFGSSGLALWAAAFFVINTTYFIASEEPGLEKRFGEEYRDYRAAVPRWLPRRTPWTPSGQAT